MGEGGVWGKGALTVRAVQTASNDVKTYLTLPQPTQPTPHPPQRVCLLLCEYLFFIYYLFMVPPSHLPTSPAPSHPHAERSPRCLAYKSEAEASRGKQKLSTAPKRHHAASADSLAVHRNQRQLQLQLQPSQDEAALSDLAGKCRG